MRHLLKVPLHDNACEVANWISRCPLLGSVYCVTSILQRAFPGKILRRVLFVPVMNRLGACWVFYQGVVTLPFSVWVLMHFHFDFYTFVDSLNRHFGSPSRFQFRPWTGCILRLSYFDHNKFDTPWDTCSRGMKDGIQTLHSKR